MDITEFRLRDGKKVFLQVIMDNFSRKVINWKISSNRKQSLSVSNLIDATKNKSVKYLMSDEEGENIGTDPKDVD